MLFVDGLYFLYISSLGAIAVIMTCYHLFQEQSSFAVGSWWNMNTKC